MLKRMDSRYWKEFENMRSRESKKHSDSEERSPRYRKSGDSRRKRSRSYSHSSSSSSSGSSSRSSSSSSRHHSDSHSHSSYSRDKRDRYRRSSPSRATVRSNSYGSVDREEGRPKWFPPPQQFPSQSQDSRPPAHLIQNQYPQGPPPGQYPPNYQGPNFGSNYQPFGNYEQPPPSNFYPPNFPPHSGSQPPPHNYPLTGGPPNQGPGHPPGNWDMFPETMLPPPIIPPASGEGLPGGPPIGSLDMKAEEAAKKEAIEQELLQQKKSLSKQREDYVRRKFSLNRELSRLKDQKRDLLKEKSKENERILRENAKLQGEILQKLKAIDNVIEMLSNIIGDSTRLPEIIKELKQMEKEKSEEKVEKVEKVKKAEKKKHSPERGEKRKRSESVEVHHSHDEEDSERNCIYYDPGLHWCPDCCIFPKTVSEYLGHLHSEEHKLNAKMKFEDYPWHSNQNLEEKSPPNNSNLPTKRMPIRGVQFLIPATAWFCKMCKVWLGDSHCASKHVQSKSHAQHYSEFILKNPHWEVDWLTERTRSYEKKSEAKQQQQQQQQQQQLLQQSVSVPNPAVPSELGMIGSLSNQLLAMISSSKPQNTPPPPTAAPISSSSSSSEDSSDRGSKKKKKKAKKNKTKDRSPPKEKSIPNDQLKLNYKSMPDKKMESIPVDDNFIANWMPRLDKRKALAAKEKAREENEVVPSKKVFSGQDTRGSESREPSSEGDKKSSPYQHFYDRRDHDSYDKKYSHFDRDSRSRRKYEEDSKYDRNPRQERESPKEKYNKYRSHEKNKYEKEEKHDDYKIKKDLKNQKDNFERDNKSPFSRIKESIEKKKSKNKIIEKEKEKTSDDDADETAFEKRSSESAAKKKDGKKLVMVTFPKTKLPFIGRMPILKKKVDQKPEDKENDKKEHPEEDVPKSTPPLPLLPEAPPLEKGLKAIAETKLGELPKSTLIISKRPRLAEPGIVKKEILFNKPANDNLTEQDMELDEESVVVPKEEEAPKDELHKDFKDALDLLFPEDKKKEDEGTEVKEEPEVKLEQLPPAIAVPPPGYMMPAGYDMSMYPYYDQQAYVQQWQQMPYDQASHYPPGAYAYPPPMGQPAPVEVPPQPVPEPEPPAEPKKKKNAPSQRMRRHLMKKRAKEAAEKASEVNVDESQIASVDEEEEEEEEAQENGEENTMPTANPPKRPSEIADLAMLGIDEDDAAAMGFC